MILINQVRILLPAIRVWLALIQGDDEQASFLMEKESENMRKCLEQKVSNIPENRCFWEVYDLAMICFLMGDFENGIKIFENYLEKLQGNFYAGEVFIERHETFYKHCIHHIKPCLTSKEAAQKMVLDMIKRRRNYFNSKPSFKKMNKEMFLMH